MFMELKNIFCFIFPNKSFCFLPGWRVLSAVFPLVKQCLGKKITWRPVGTFVHSTEDVRHESRSWGDMERRTKFPLPRSYILGAQEEREER